MALYRSIQKLTAQSRLKLYSYFRKLVPRVLNVDTDSLVFPNEIQKKIAFVPL